MNVQQEIFDKNALDSMADDNGLAIAIVDASGEVSVSNNNSICRNLNPDGKFVDQCADFCGTALEEVTEVGSSVSFTCHAGLECRAIPIRNADRPLVAIVGRTFVTAENYRKATTRAISGDWSNYPPSEFFENILLTGSVDVLDKAAKQIESMFTEGAVAPRVVKTPTEVESETSEKPIKRSPEVITNIVEKFNHEIGLQPDITERAAEAEAENAAETKPISKPNEKRTAEARAWRSFFGSLLKSDYAKASDSILGFLAHQYGFSALIWLERKEDRFENTATFGEMKNRKVRLGIAPN